MRAAVQSRDRWQGAKFVTEPVDRFIQLCSSSDTLANTTTKPMLLLMVAGPDSVAAVLAFAALHPMEGGKA